MMHEFLYLVKNLRGILALPGTDASVPEPLIKWLGLRYRNRKIGFWSGAPLAPDQALSPDLPPAVQRLQRRPFVALDLPAALKPLIELFAPEQRLWLAQALLANVYCSPLILSIQEAASNIPAAGIVWSLQTSANLSDADLKFNLRLADYAMTDFLQSLIPGTLIDLQLATSAEVLTELLSRRSVAAEGDGHARYWRLEDAAASQEAPALQVIYFDWLALLNAELWPQWHQFLKERPEFWQTFSHLLNLTVTVALAPPTG